MRLNPEKPEPVLIDDPGVLSVHIEECGEPLVDLRSYHIRATTCHPRAKSPAETRLHCRQDVAQRLVVADQSLPNGIRLLVLECHRPIELQTKYWNADLESLRERYPAWSDEELARENAKFVAPPWIVPPHSTGGAVDLVLVNEVGDELDMGSPLNVEGLLMRTDAAGLPDEARENRAMLLQVMENAGFVNYPYEWWHFSYGDRYWAFIMGEPSASYATV